jgi:hypothetical protein
VSVSQVFSFLRTVVMNLLRRSGYRSIRRGLRELAHEIKGILALGGIQLAETAPELTFRRPCRRQRLRRPNEVKRLETGRSEPLKG